MAGYLTLSAVAPNTMHAVTIAKVPWNTRNSAVGIICAPFPVLGSTPCPRM